MARSYGSFILNRIEEVPSEGIAYIFANNSNARAIVNLDEGLLVEIRKRTWTHNQSLNYFVNRSESEYLHSFIMAYYLGETNIIEGRKRLKDYVDKDFHTDHFQNNNRSEADARMDCRIQNLHLVEQGQNKANYSTFYFSPYEFHSVMHKGCFGSYITDGIYEVYKVYDKSSFSEYLAEKNYFYLNGLIELLKKNIDDLKEQPESEYRDSQLAAVKQIIHNGNMKAEANHKEALKLLEEYNIELGENETRMIPGGYVVSNVDVSPSKLREIQSDFVIVSENQKITKKIIQNIEDIFCIKDSSF